MLILVVYDKKRRENTDSRSVRQRGRKLILVVYDKEEGES